MNRAAKPILLFLLAALLLAGCAERSAQPDLPVPAETATPEPAPTPGPTATPEPTPGPISALDREFTGRETVLDLRNVSPRRIDEILRLIPQLPLLERIELAPAEGAESDWQLEDLSRLRENTDPRVDLSCRFSLFGRTVSSADEEIVYYREPIGDEQLPALRQALPLLSGCRRLLLDDCGLTYAKLAELREEYPERGLCWRVRWGVDSALTDTDTIWSASVLDENCDVLKYCTEVVNLDIGENHLLSDFHFLAYMPKLQVVIVSHTEFDDCDFVTHCPDLEFLEIDHCKVSDVTALAQCGKLQHLSLENDLLLSDITALYGLTNLRRLRVSMVPLVPEEQKEELVRRLPDCHLIFESNRFEWRFDSKGNIDPRYALLREQFGYNGYYVPSDAFDWDDIVALGYTWKSVFTAS